MTTDWKFPDAPDTACYTTTFVLNKAPILRVYHEYDGDWQFHGAQEQVVQDEAKLVSLAAMVQLDDTLTELSDLPYGWSATRSGPSSHWEREKDNPYPSFADNGYYLEDAVWLSEYQADLAPPGAELRENIAPGTYVKLVFRFADEQSARADGQCERIWVQVTSADENSMDYSGTITNDPQHAAARFDDAISFHPLHIAEIESDD
jgi:hypothetical protein